MRLLKFLILIAALMLMSPAAHRGYAGLSSRTFDFVYSVTVRDIPQNATRLDLWIPVPQTTAHQEISNLKIDCKYPQQILVEPEYKNKMAYVNIKGKLPRELEMTLSCTAVRKSVSSPDNPEQISDAVLQRFLKPDRLVPIDGKIAAEASSAIAEKKEATAEEKARAIFDDVTETMIYDKSRPGWGRGDAIYACDARRGNCTDFHSLFIGMARASSIPSKFVIGFPLPSGKASGEIPGYHCWAEFYIKGKGWLPVDASEAYKHPEKHDFFFGGLDANRIELTTGRDISLQPSTAYAKPLNYFIYPFVLIDAKPWPKVEKHFSFANIRHS
ncbi:MAG: transglutaminase domain-containing protein [Deltaproteobacteria bacterium]|nr:transglutaminase domain-containing protein [Deltaproteobacteria bacterium]